MPVRISYLIIPTNPDAALACLCLWLWTITVKKNTDKKQIGKTYEFQVTIENGL